MPRRILLITTDQMHFDALGCNGGRVARTPAIDRLAAEGIRYERAHCQNVVCMPARATIVTGQYPRTHGVWMNGVALPDTAPNVARHLQGHGFKTALVGKAHFEPWFGGKAHFRENRMANEGDFGPHRGFDHMELANHFILGTSHYDRFMIDNHGQWVSSFYPIVGKDGRQNSAGGGDTGAVQVWHNDTPRELYHTDWVADRTLAWLGGLGDEDDWFVWMSFPDPHHPFDPPRSELGRVDWRDLELPSRYPRSHDERVRLLDRKPRHWRGAYDATLHTNIELPPGFVARDMTPDQLREVEAMNHIENELVDEACERVLSALRARAWLDQTDVFFTTDHGELLGDFGLLFKGPYHVDSLLRVPLIWKPGTGAVAEVVTRPVGHVNLAPTLCAIAGLDVPQWMDGVPLPRSDADADGRGIGSVVTEWDSEHARPGAHPMDRQDAISLHLRTIFRGGWLCTVYEPSSLYDGTEGELYDLSQDPLAHENLWNDAARRAIRDELSAEIRASLPRVSNRLPRAAPV